jgi:hypothetical protein
MEDCLFALAHLQENNMVHADLRPELISVPIKRGQNFKIMDRLGDPSPPNQVQLNNIKGKKSLFMSPTLYHALMSKQSKVRHNPFKSDVFSLGMVILKAGLLESVEGVYSSEKREIEHSVLVDLVEKFLLRYNTNFILQEMLLVMLEFSEKLRQEPIKLLKTLQSLRDTELQDSQLLTEMLKKRDQSENVKEYLITSGGFHMKDSNLVNLTILHGLQGVDKGDRNVDNEAAKKKENNLRTSLAEMLKNRTSHDVSKQMYLLDDLPEKVEFEEDYHIGGDSQVNQKFENNVWLIFLV